MTPDQLRELSRLPLFPRTAVDLIRVAGLEGAARIITAWPGQEWPVPKRVGGGNPAGQRRWAHLCEIIGEPAAQRVVAYWGGGHLSIPNLKMVRWSRDKDFIRAEFDMLTCAKGYSSPEAVFELGIKYDVAGKTIERLLKEPDNVKAEPVDSQGSLF